MGGNSQFVSFNLLIKHLLRTSLNNVLLGYHVISIEYRIPLLLFVYLKYFSTRICFVLKSQKDFPSLLSNRFSFKLALFFFFFFFFLIFK